MEKVGTFLFGALGYIVGGLLMVGGWWLSMLNISIDRYSGTDFINTWTVIGLVMIFLGAYIPIAALKYRGHTVRKRQKLRSAADTARAQTAAAQAQTAAALAQAAEAQHDGAQPDGSHAGGGPAAGGAPGAGGAGAPPAR